MESALRLKVKGFFAFTSYENCYGVLHEQTLQLFSHIDESLDRPVALRRSISVKNAAVTKKTDLKDGVQFSLRIEYDDKPVNPAVQHKKGGRRQRLTVDCQTADCHSQWYSALEKATSHHLDREERLALPGKCCEKLKIPADAPLSRMLIVKKYRKLCLQMHPDRGGDPSAFADLNQAYNSLLSLQLEEDDKGSCTLSLIRVILVKGPNGVGLALSLMEDRVRGEVVVNEVFPGMIRHPYSDTTPIEVGDAIVGIGEDSDCRGWPLSRVRARLSLSRVPIGGSVVITFERRVPIEDIPESETVPASLVDELYNLPQEGEQAAHSGRRSSLSAALISTGRRQSIASRRISILTAATEDDPSADLEKDLAPALRSHRRASLLTSDLPYLEQQQEQASPEPQSPASGDESGDEPDASSPEPFSHHRSPTSAASQLFVSADVSSPGMDGGGDSYDNYFSLAQPPGNSRGKSPVRWEAGLESEDETSPSEAQARGQAHSLQAMGEADTQLIDTLKTQLVESRLEEARHSRRASMSASHYHEEIEVLTKQCESYKKLLDSKYHDESQEVRLLASKVLDLEARLAQSEAERSALETSLNNMRYALRHGPIANKGEKAHHTHAAGPVGDALQLAGVRYDAVLSKAEVVIGGLEKVIKDGAARRIGRDTRATAHGRIVPSTTKIPVKAKNKSSNLQ